MKNNTRATALCLACLAGLTAFTPAHALRRSHDGTGQAILLPYYTVEEGRSTLISITNHTDQPKAIGLVVAEGRNGRAALAFNIYLSGRDTWTGALSSASNGVPVLESSEESCTSPTLPTLGVSLRNFAYTGSNDDGLGNDVARLRSGFIEIVELGVLKGEAATIVEQRNCSALSRRHVPDGIWAEHPNADVTAPTGRLSADAQIVDVADGVAFDTAPFAIDEFSAGPRHGNPGSNYAQVRLTKPTLSPQQSEFIVEGTMIVPSTRPADAMSLLFMASEVEAGFLLDPSLDASTEWVVTFPTRQAYLDNRPGGERPLGAAPVAPFVSVPGTAPNCNPVSWQVIKGDGDVLPPIAKSLCTQVSTLHFRRAEATEPFVVSSQDVEAGWAQLGLRPDVHRLNYTTVVNGGAGQLWGLPVLVQPLIEARNSNAQPGVLATYAISGVVVRKQDGTVDF